MTDAGPDRSTASVACLLVGAQEDSPWALVLADALAPWASLHVVPKDKVLQVLGQAKYDLIIVDATRVEQVSTLVAHLYDRYPHMPVVVGTMSPTWRRAREAIQAGAVDYIRKSLNKEGTWRTLSAILSRLGLLSATERTGQAEK